MVGPWNTQTNDLAGNICMRDDMYRLRIYRVIVWANKTLLLGTEIILSNHNLPFMYYVCNMLYTSEMPET